MYYIKSHLTIDGQQGLFTNRLLPAKFINEVVKIRDIDSRREAPFTASDIHLSDCPSHKFARKLTSTLNGQRDDHQA